MPNSILRNLTEYSVNMESAEFEKYYDILAEDRVWAMQVFNSESIEAFVELRNFFKKAIQVKIRRNKIYFRLKCGDLFEPPKLKNAINFDLLYKYYRIIDIPRYMYEAIIDNIATNAGDRTFSRSVRMSKFTEKELQEELKREQKELETTWFSTKKEDK